MTPFWKTCLVEALEKLGGEADWEDIYPTVESLDYLGEKDIEESKYGGRPNYQHSLRACASEMVDKGELIRVRPGRFRLPQSG